MTAQNENVTPSPWAKKLADQWSTAHQAVEEKDHERVMDAVEAIDALRVLVDRAVSEAQTALQSVGVTLQNEQLDANGSRRLTMLGPDGGTRQLTITVSLAAVEGKVSGGAVIESSTTRATMFLAPEITEKGELLWIVQKTSTDVTPELFGDIMLSVFVGDFDAATRLADHFDAHPENYSV